MFSISAPDSNFFAKNVPKRRRRAISQRKAGFQLQLNEEFVESRFAQRHCSILRPRRLPDYLANVKFPRGNVKRLWKPARRNEEMGMGRKCIIIFCRRLLRIVIRASLSQTAHLGIVTEAHIKLSDECSSLKGNEESQKESGLQNKLRIGKLI